MKNKNLIKNPLVLLLTVIVGIAGSILIHRQTFFEYRPANAAIEMHNETAVSGSTSSVEEMEIARDELGNTVAVWTATSTDKDVYYRLFNPDGSAAISETLVTSTITNNQYEPDVAMDKNGNFIVVWTSFTSIFTGDQVLMQPFQAGGIPIGSPVTVNTTTADDQNQPKISMVYDTEGGLITDFVVTWTSFNGSDEDIMYRKYQIDFTGGTPATALIGEQTANSITTLNQNQSDVAMNNSGSYIITWNHDEGTQHQIMYRAFPETGSPISIESPVEASGTAVFGRPAVTAAKLPSTSGIFRYAITYEADFDPASTDDDGIAARTLICNTSLVCSLESPEITASADTTSTESYTYPDIAADYLGNFTVVWQDSEVDGNGSGIAGKSYNYKGQQIGSKFNVNTTNIAGDQAGPSISMNTDGFYDVSFINLNNDTAYFKKYITEIFKVLTETTPHTADPSNTQADTASAISERSATFNHVIAWKDYTDNSIRFTLRSVDRYTDPANPVIDTLQSDVRVDDPTSVNSDNPAVSFFKDATNCNKFVIVWESDLGLGDGKDIYYQIYDAGGNPEGTRQIINTSTAGNQTRPAVSAGQYNNGLIDIKEFAVGWIDENPTPNTFESAYYYETGFTYASLDNCLTGTCESISTSMHPTNHRAVYAYEKLFGSDSADVYVIQAESGLIDGSATEVNNAAPINRAPDVDFITDSEFVVAYQTKPTVLTPYYSVAAQHYSYAPGASPGWIGNIQVSNFPLGYEEQAPKISAYPTGDSAKQHFIITYQIYIPSYTNNKIYGQLFDYSGGSINMFGPAFSIPSTPPLYGQQFADVGYNQLGMAIVSWEGAVGWDGISVSDTAGIGAQLIQNPLNTETAEFLPVCEQVITAGGLTIEAPNSISFLPVNTSVTESVTHEVSIRDSIYGGDIKYIEVRDAKGEDFTLSVQISDFVSDEDGKVYIKSGEHFRVKNWDDDITDTNFGCSPGTPSDCFLTQQSTYTPTAFGLSTETENYTYADTQKVLAVKSDTMENEIGKYRFYPKFEITVPPIIPAGLHEATITFTLVN